MTEYVQVVLIANVFRVVCLLVGLGFGYLGYRLYAIGVFEKAQELKATFGKANLTVKQVAPGIVFGIAGIVIAILGVVRPLSVERTQSPVASAQQTPMPRDRTAASAPDRSERLLQDQLRIVESCLDCTIEQRADRKKALEKALEKERLKQKLDSQSLEVSTTAK